MGPPIFTVTVLYLLLNTVLPSYELGLPETSLVQRHVLGNPNKSHNDIIVKDNHKPVFADCATYSPSVNEEVPPPATVMTVKATDVDDDKLTYKFVLKADEKKKFNIDEKTGEITTNIMFDRDDPVRQKEMFVTVQATDAGRPVLADVCTFKITINDMNDNAPLFDKSSYTESIPEDLQVNKEVMRISASDIDEGDNSKVIYSFDNSSYHEQYFSIDEATGIITLKKQIPPGLVNSVMKIRAIAKDKGNPPQSAEIELEIKIVDSNKKAPTITKTYSEPIYLKENFNDYEKYIATVSAQSNMDNTELQFRLDQGRTEQTNKISTFLLLSTKSDPNSAYIVLGAALDYESITEYTLTVRVLNKDSLSAVTKIIIKIEDVNDNIPSFLELVTGTVLENEPAGTPVMQVQANDKDGTSPNNEVIYELADHHDYFHIDKRTGNITTKQSFDRESNSIYNVKVIAKDGAPSALYKNRTEPNKAEQVFRITIEDKNDNPPKFTQSEYVAEEILESIDTNKMVIEVKAEDKDTASSIHYKIIGGNTGNAFVIEKTGKVMVLNKLDYETTKEYVLKIVAYDGKYNDTAEVKITIVNVNDVLPEFIDFVKNVTIDEETLPTNCLIKVRARDPDKQPDEPQEIIFSTSSVSGKENEGDNFLTVDANGCVKLTKKLDRDPPNGISPWQALITATDENGGPTSQSLSQDFFIYLNDINDNAPFLNKTEVVWPENKSPKEGPIMTLQADDADAEPNGAPFKYRLAPDASPEITKNFEIQDDELWALVIFDREEKKSYEVPISISDNGLPTQTGVSFLTVIIGDINDNPMKPGSSKIYVNSRGNMPPTKIGRIYVEDLDDWDLPDKEFGWDQEDDHFDLDSPTGELTMRTGTQEGVYELKFRVTERSPWVNFHEVSASVIVVVKMIPDVAIQRSGSIRLVGKTAEDFIQSSSRNELSMKDALQKNLASLMNVTLENLDILSVLHSPVHGNKSLLDVRYSAHGSPYHWPEQLNTKTTLNQAKLHLESDIYLVNIAECLNESVCPSQSCTNYLNISDIPYVVTTNKTSYVGVSAVVEPKCSCSFKDDEDSDNYCENGGTRQENSHCNCPVGYEGPHCESLSISFIGNGWAMYPPFETCNFSELTLEIMTSQENGLIFYVGPLTNNLRFKVKDFMSLELRDGYPVLLMDYGSGTVKIEHKWKQLSDGLSHFIYIKFLPASIELQVDNCHMSSCVKLAAAQGPNKALNVNGPLQVGGSVVELKKLATDLSWNFSPTDIGFAGCIKNLTYNGKTYDLGKPRYAQNAFEHCNNIGPRAAAFGIDSNFLVALLVCLAILLILLLAVVVHRRKHDHWNEKELDDIRENIINYEDEGGGEVDTGFDLELLRRENQFDEPIKTNELYTRKAPDEVPDISGFLRGKKDVCDKDPEFNPFDDVRYYAYEGDGNTSRSSLSSLASCTDEGDLKFNYLSNFGPRFRKLADMYGEEPSDDDAGDGGEESWC